MGKKARKTRWRALTLADELSDSEASSITTAPGLHEVFKSQKLSSIRYTYSSQSTPRRKYQYDGTKSTRSSSTTSENKTSFNEDDYTKISTPRQDVLFKKGYLNKPKNYHTQTSTGASTNSTGNSTGNGTPDYQSTDLEYESQFVFPNGFVDHNGFYYVNGYEYPFMFYNVPTYYPEYSNYRSKRCSSGSLTESTSPNNEEITSQDLSGAEASNTHSDYSGHFPLRNQLNNHTADCPHYHQNGSSSPHGAENRENPIQQTRKIKKRRRRRTASQSEERDSTDNSDEETIDYEERTAAYHEIDFNKNTLDKPSVVVGEQNETCSEVACDNIDKRLLENDDEEANANDHSTFLENSSLCIQNDITTSANDLQNTQNVTENLKSRIHPEDDDTKSSTTSAPLDISSDSDISHCDKSNDSQTKDVTDISSNQKISEHSDSSHQKIIPDSEASIHPEKTNSSENIDKSTTNETSNSDISEMVQHPQDHEENIPKYDLKPDAEEFIPRAYRAHDIPINPVPFINISGNFVPIPLFPFNGQSFSPPFIPPGIPINFIPPNFIGIPHNGPLCNGRGDNYNEEQHGNPKTRSSDITCDNSNTANDTKVESEPIDKNKISNKTIDIATVVSKLEVAAKEQEEMESSALIKTIPDETKAINLKKHSRSPRFIKTLNYSGNYNNRSQNSPQREIRYRNKDLSQRTSPLTNVETNHDQKKNISVQNVENHHSNNPSFKPNSSPVNNSPSKQCVNNSLGNCKMYSFRQPAQNISSTQSPLKKNDESFRKSPYRSNITKSQTTTFMPSVATGSLEVKNSSTLPSNIDSLNLSRRSPDKFKKVWKQSNNVNNKWKPCNTVSNNRSKTLANKQVDNEFKTEAITKNVSETLKIDINSKHSFQINDDENNETKNSPKTEAAKEANLPQETSTTLLRSPNQWISVQKRKKRKNKNVEEVDNFTDEEVDDIQSDQFESYDVSLLVDVIVSPEKECPMSPKMKNDEFGELLGTQAQNNEEVLTVIVETEYSPPGADTASSFEPKEITETSNRLENQEDVEIHASINGISAISVQSGEVSSTENKVEPCDEIAKDKKKKIKKNVQKPLKKKVIIKDVDLSDQYVDLKEPIKKIVTKVEKAPVSISNVCHGDIIKDPGDESRTETIPESDKSFEKEASPESVNSCDQDDKKKAKKKKKRSPRINNSNASFNADSILGPVEDTFDFLNSALTGEAEDKTNDEISQELDKIIQKGMLSSIEEKIKSLNIDEGDGFFKSVWTKLSRKESNMGYTKIPDFTEILKPTVKSNLVSEELDLQNKNCSEILQPDSVEPTTEDGLFLDNPDLMEVLEDDDKPATSQETVEAEETKHAKYEIEIGKIEPPNTSYPITNAVKEWMCRTRETTPDVELLKSPSRIYEEFGDISDSDSETQKCDSIGERELTPYSEITLFSTEKEQSVEQDLMDYWEDDVKDNKNVNVNKEYESNDIKTLDEDDVLPVYESQYGKNEDFLEIQRKIREQQTRPYDGPPAAHTSLPQRAAVCCNIM